MNTLELNALYKSYGAHCALDNVSLSVPSGSRQTRTSWPVTVRVK